MFSLFGITFHLYGLTIGIAIVVAIWLLEKILKQQKITLTIEQVLIPTFIGGVVGARLYHLITDWSLYKGATFWELIAVWNGGLGIIGGFIGGIIGIWVGLYLQKKHSKLLHILDMTAIVLPLSQAIGRWGNYFNQELFGRPSNLPWAIRIDSVYRPVELKEFSYFHPLFLYESVLNLLLFGILWRMYSKKIREIGTGAFLGLYLIGYGSIRWGLEYLRIDTARWDNGLDFFSIAQWMMVVMILAGAFVLKASLWSKKK